MECIICKETWQHRVELSAHLQSYEHFLENLKCCLWLDEEPFLRNKRNVSVSCMTTKTCVPAVYINAELHQTAQRTMRIKVSSASNSAVCLQRCSLLELDDTFCLENIGTIPTTGIKRNGIVFSFCTDSAKTKPFVIVRFFELVCRDDRSEKNILEPLIPYEYQLPVPRLPDAMYIIPAECIGRFVSSMVFLFKS